MTKTSDWIPILLPKGTVRHSSHMELLKSLQNKAKKVKLFGGMNKQQIIKKLHQQRKKILKETPHDYINYTA